MARLTRDQSRENGDHPFRISHDPPDFGENENGLHFLR
jgi:hypothetical protein